ncbi:hypothetical protein C5C31_10350 [Rathayibacter rathayi]|uniref:hypothetical protein n=1 Tax=Rathayibacter rathayi TaxID=33887 RepID=UPI000CE822C6|nr:hypothetical protein [Rathayibacter rathayi]PPG68061.1 hypothetical protein C5C02_08625 [Rathayibacter rathayi]PPG76072.1 hypothetical protein C5C23_08590 [Rathayibacter rathayi]PPH21144.1 hypothetical protein C5C31_10350 [Rathayibacter rathayi]PPI75364.1 hypothetical protein C5E03_14055 [Rathayibacter rathayi]
MDAGNCVSSNTPDLAGEAIVGLQEHRAASLLAARAFAVHGLGAVVPAHFAQKRPVGDAV